MNYFLEIILYLISRDLCNFFDFLDFNNDKFSSSDYLFYFWEIESEDDDSELDDLLKKGIINEEDVNILKKYRREILLDIQSVLNEIEDLNISKKESIKLLWKCLKKYELSDNYIKYIIRGLYKFL